MEADNLADLAVTTAKINTSAVTTLKINDDAVTADKIADDVVGTNHIAFQPCVTGAYKNLKAVYTNATTVTVTADELVLTDGTKSVLIKTVSEAIAITTAGASGLDTGAEAANTIYYIWIIRKSADGTVNGLLSASATSPTLPSGYDQYALITAVGNNASSNFIPFTLEGDDYSFNTGILIASGSTSSSWTAIDLTPETLTCFVPSALSTRVLGSINTRASHHGYVSNITSDGTISDLLGKNRVGSYGNSYTSLQFYLHVLTADTIYYVTDGAEVTIYLHGFIQNKR